MLKEIKEFNKYNRVNSEKLMKREKWNQVDINQS